MLHITYNMCTCDLPDIYALIPTAYISGKSLVPVLQPYYMYIHYIKTHDSESRGQEEAQQRDHRVSYLHVALPSNSQSL